ncbi:MAG: hypothetical protein GY711_27335 [bacterium]|nr:hypothetical protein [bacterium]
MSATSLTSGEKITMLTMACALVCLVLSILVGALGALYYMPALADWMQTVHLSLIQLRPLHTTFASAWIFLGAVACISYFLFESKAPTPSEKLRFKIQMVCWGSAGLGALLTLPFGLGSGREYIGILPVFSVLILAGWTLFAINFFGRVARGFWSRPAYVYMWSVGILYFMYTFIEGHAHLLPWVKRYPVADLQVQWKSCGTLVAAFNQMIYGSLIYVGERISGDKRPGQSRTAFALFGVGLLNSFTNYAHHTYHLPQSHLVKWIAFWVSMLEIILLVLVFREVTGMASRKRRSTLDFQTSTHFIELSKYWNSCLLFLALLISVPPLNALIHGTHTVMAHAMGSELAIDSYILFAVFANLLASIFPKRETLREYVDSQSVHRTARLLNVSLIGLIVWLLARGTVTGVTRYLGRAEPDWVGAFPYVFAVLGIAVGLLLLRFVAIWVPLFVDPDRHRAWSPGRARLAREPADTPNAPNAARTTAYTVSPVMDRRGD